MKNGLYSIHLRMLDGVKGRDSSVLVLRDGVIAGSLMGAELSHQAISRWCYA